MQDPASELRRIPLPRTLVNKGKRAKGRPLRPALVALSGGRPPIYRLVLVRHAVLALHHFAVERPRGAEEGRIRKAVVDGRCLAV